ncbi:hypothetical protein J6590_038757 [Homalodisca vitripennis]|nr:hypothetical protein J6590_038757 [Homalodisca vitripennis]
MGCISVPNHCQPTIAQRYQSSLVGPIDKKYQKNRRKSNTGDKDKGGGREAVEKHKTGGSKDAVQK